MTTLADVLRSTTDLGPADAEWLHLLVGDWQLIADLSFSDLVLWVRTGHSDWQAVAHVRPNTGPMVFYDDVVGRVSTRARRQLLSRAASAKAVVAGPEPHIQDDMSIREEYVPVVRQGTVVAVMSRHTNLRAARQPSRLELTYAECTSRLCRMIASGEFPGPVAPTGLRRGAPRVGDGVIRLDADGRIVYSSPNATSAVHRLGHVGNVIGELLPKVVTDLLQRGGRNVDESLALVITGRAPWRSDLETTSASVSLRAIPFTEGGRRIGAMVLVRDVSELRRREQELLTKDATIREIHHRVKNNLQTVAALLRLQARRIPDPGAQSALWEAVRRVGTIALVHETLSSGFDETVDFDEIAVRGLHAVVEVATREHPVESTFSGSFGRLRAEDATSLAMVLSELVQNAVEHGLIDRGGRIGIHAERSVSETDEQLLAVTITDDGVGLPSGHRPSLAGLGTRIVTSLVQDLRGRIRWSNRPEGGTKVEFTAVLR